MVYPVSGHHVLQDSFGDIIDGRKFVQILLIDGDKLASYVELRFEKVIILFAISFPFVQVVLMDDSRPDRLKHQLVEVFSAVNHLFHHKLCDARFVFQFLSGNLLKSVSTK